MGLLVRLPRGAGAGARVIQLERQMSDHNPVLVHSRDLVDRLVAETGLDALVSELYGQSVINVAPAATTAPAGLGRGWPLTCSARPRVWCWPTCSRARSSPTTRMPANPGLDKLGPD